MEGSTSIIFIILAFSLGAILILKKEDIPPRLRRAMALITLVLVAFAFFIIVASFLSLGSNP